MQEDLGGELFSLGDLFPSSDCAGMFLNYLPVTDNVNISVVTNFGTVQSKIGELLSASTEKLWVNAQRVGQTSASLYRYEGESPFTYHSTTNHEGDCLTYSSDSNGELISIVSNPIFH